MPQFTDPFVQEIAYWESACRDIVTHQNAHRGKGFGFTDREDDGRRRTDLRVQFVSLTGLGLLDPREAGVLDSSFFALLVVLCRTKLMIGKH